MRIGRVGLALLASLLVIGSYTGGIPASASPSSVLPTGAISAAAQGYSPVFVDLEAFSSDDVAVAAGDIVTVLVTAIYDGGAGPAIPCSDLNLGVVDDADAAFRNDAAGPWPASAWRNPQRVAAAGCDGEVTVGTRVYWPVDLSIPTDTEPGVYPVGTFSPVWDGVGWSESQITLSVTVTGPAGVAETAPAERPVFSPLEVSSGENVAVAAGERVTVGVAATLEDPGDGGDAIPCDELNLGVVDDAIADFRDDAEGGWEQHGWLNPSRVAADGCTGEVRAGDRVRWAVRLSVPARTPPGAYPVGAFSPVWDGVGWSAEQITLAVTVTEPEPLLSASATPVVDIVGLTPEAVTPIASPVVEVVPTETVPVTDDLPEPVSTESAQPGRIVVSVVDEGSQPLSGDACFEVYADAGQGARGAFIDGACDAWDGSGDGTVTLDGLPGGDLVLVENAPPQGYDVAADRVVTVVAGEDARVTVVQVSLTAATEAATAGADGTTGERPVEPEPTPEAQDAATTPPPGYGGTWEGVAVQVDPPDEFPVTIAITGGTVDEVVASVEYPSYGCVGELRLDRIDPGALQLTEFISVGAGTCADGGAMTLALNPDGTLAFSWNSPDGGTSAGATLLPVDGPTDTTTDPSSEPTPAETTEPTETEVAPEATSQRIAPTDSGALVDATATVEQEADTLPPLFAGTWEGRGVQTNPDVEWPVTITFRGGGVGAVVASVEYPTYGCLGELTLDRVEPERGRVVMTENITVGVGTCESGGSMALYLEPDGSLTFDWSNPDGSSTATATLENEDGLTEGSDDSIVEGGGEGFPAPDETPLPDQPEPVDDADASETDSGSTRIQSTGGNNAGPSSDEDDDPEASDDLDAPQPPVREPDASDEATDADARAAANAAVEISRFEEERDFDALYDAMHPDARAVVPREVLVGWYGDYLATQDAGELTVTEVRFVDWTWEVTGVTYPNTAEIQFVQPFVADGVETEVVDTLRLVEDDGEWRWFFGRNREFVEDQIEQYGSDAESGAGTTGIAIVLAGWNMTPPVTPANSNALKTVSSRTGTSRLRLYIDRSRSISRAAVLSRRLRAGRSSQ